MRTKKRDRLLFRCISAPCFSTVTAHASHPPWPTRWTRLPCAQSWQRRRGRVSQRCGLCRIPRPVARQPKPTIYPLRAFGFCLMPNHFHLVLQPTTADALSPFMGENRGTGYFSLASLPSFLLSCPVMPRIPRGQLAGHAYHVLNRGNGGAAIFHKDADYAAFLSLLEMAKTRFPVRSLPSV
jgi:hypothetical protein